MNSTRPWKIRDAGKWFVLSAVVAAAYVAGAGAQLGVGGTHPTNMDLRQAIRAERIDERTARDYRCIPWRHYRWEYVWMIPAPKLKGVLVWQQNLTAHIRHLPIRCGASPRAIIVDVFGARAAAALRVAECESHLYPRAIGAAGERGLFQIHPVHRSWLGSRWARLFEPRVNARVAYGMSDGGTNWSAWSCKP